MSFQATVKAYSGITVTLAVDVTSYNLYELLKAIDPNCPPTCREANIQFDPTQAAAAGSLLIGDSDIDDSPQRCAFNCIPGQSFTFGAGATLREIYLNNIYLRASGMTGMIVNVMVQN